KYLLSEPNQVIDAFDIQFNETDNAANKTIELAFNTNKQMSPDVIYQLEVEFELQETFKVVNPFPHFSHKSFSPVFIHLQTGKRQLLIKTEKPFAFYTEKRKQSNSFIISFIIDAPFLHPAWDYRLKQRRSIANPLQPLGTAYYLKAVVHEFNKESNLLPLQQFTYPFARQSAFILTDHCDFDNEEKLQTFLYGLNNNGWLGRGLKISKGVFTIGPKPGEPKKNTSLEDTEYARLIQLLFKDGSEIVPHALKSKGQLSSTEFHNAMEQLSENYYPRTWIDHGSYLKYCYSQGAKENKDYLLVETLKKHHYNNLWSFHDVNTDALQTLNIFTAKKYGPWKALAFAFKYFILGKWLVAAHYLRSIIHRNYSKNIIIEYLMYAMASTKQIFINYKNKKGQVKKDIADYVKSLGAFGSWRNNSPVPYKSGDVLKYSVALYTEERRPLSQYKPGDLLMFYTFETTHLKDIYTKKALDVFIKEYGTHIGHTYILNDLPYINSIFKVKKGKYQLIPEWIQFLDILEGYVKSNHIWNANMGEYVHHIIQLSQVCITYISADSILIKNNNSAAFYGYTFIVPAAFKYPVYIDGILTKAEITDMHYQFFVLTLPSLGTVNISYSNTH
ncbi:MAG: hypothetical protein ABI921_15250, partial [Panacibacter sp.]